MMGKNRKGGGGGILQPGSVKTERKKKPLTRVAAKLFLGAQVVYGGTERTCRMGRRR